MKAGSCLVVAAGCLLGLFAALSVLPQSGDAARISLPWLHIFTLSFQMDSISAFFLLPIFIISPLAMFYSFHYMEKQEQSFRTAINYFFNAILIVSMALVACADNIPTFALAWEIMSVSSYFLVVHDFQNKETRQAGYLYFIFAQGGAMLLFAAFALVYSYTGDFAFAGFAAIPDSVKLVVFILAFLGFGSKAGIFPLHIWLPYAHPAAPSHISAIMSGVMIKMGIYGIIRIYALLGVPSMVFGQIVLLVGMATGVLGVVYALGNQDVKKLLAYSSVENIGIILIGLGVGMIGVATKTEAMAFFGFAGAFMHVLNHSIFKSLLFMGAGAVLHKAKTRSIDQLGGLMKRMPVTGRTFLVGSLAISGLPPFSGFIGEFLIYYGSFQGIHLQRTAFILSALAIISLAVIGGLAAACFTKLVGLAFLGEPRTEKAAQACEAGLSMKLTMILLALACLLIGILPEPFVRLAFSGIAGLQVAGAYNPQAFIELLRNISQTAALFIALFLLVSLLRKGLYWRKEVGAGPTWGCGFTRPTVRMQYTGTSYAASMIDFYRPFVPVKTFYSGIRKIFPGQTIYYTEVLDIAENKIHEMIIKPFFHLLQMLRWIQHGNIHLYIAYIVAAIIVMLLLL
ncbi:MAG: proton-conducting transporter membrane subunit [Thermodesulfobacteriota bacterium]